MCQFIHMSTREWSGGVGRATSWRRRECAKVCSSLVYCCSALKVKQMNDAALIAQVCSEIQRMNEQPRNLCCGANELSMHSYTVSSIHPHRLLIKWAQQLSIVVSCRLCGLGCYCPCRTNITNYTAKFPLFTRVCVVCPIDLQVWHLLHDFSIHIF